MLIIKASNKLSSLADFTDLLLNTGLYIEFEISDSKKDKDFISRLKTSKQPLDC